MKKYEKIAPNRKFTEKWQIWAAIGFGAVLIAATIIFIVLFAKNIFTENVFVWCMVAFAAAFIGVGGFLFYTITKKEK